MTGKAFRLGALVLLGGVVCAVPVLVRQPRASAAPTPALAMLGNEKVTPTPASVRVEHDFVTLPDAPVTPGTAPVAVAPMAPMRVKRNGPATPRAVAERSIAQKTRRALLGDGRFRPEPFPRVR